MAIRQRSVAGTLAGLLNGAVALFVAGHVFQWILTDRWPDPPANLWPFLLALVVFLVNVGYIVIFFKDVLGGEERRYLSTRTPDGSARISIRALRAALRRSVLEQTGVSSARVRLRRETEEKVRISATVRAARERNVVELATRVREVLRSSFFRVVPEDESMELEVAVKISSLGERAAEPPEAEAPAPEAEAEEEMFTGPRYPVEDMEGV